MAKILIVEDEPVNAEVASVMMQAAGHIVGHAANGEQGWAILELTTDSDGSFDLILMDVLMPVMDGITLTRKIRASGRYPNLPIVGMTAKATAADKQECLDAGMNVVITKPFRNKELLAVIGEVLSDKVFDGE
jgi:CheY-like chemotaxis protein